jgi:hypothetical protein
MKAFESLEWDVVQCRKEAGELQGLLASSSSLKEREHILPFFAARKHLSAFLGSYHPNLEKARFGKRSIEYMGTLVVGRDHHLKPGERFRLDWRRGHVVVDSRKIQGVTFDELLADLLYRLNRYTWVVPAIP